MPKLEVQVNVYLKETGDSGDSVLLVVEEKEKEELDELHFCYSYVWKYY